MSNKLNNVTVNTNNEVNTMDNTNVAVNVISNEEAIMQKVKETAVGRYKELLDEYGYENYNSEYLKETIEEWYKQKENMREIFRKSQYWNEEEQMLVLVNKTILRSFNKAGVEEFHDWMNNQFDDHNTNSDTRCLFSKLYSIMKYSFENGYGNLINLDAVKEWFNLYERDDYKETVQNEIAPLVEGQKWSRYINTFCKKIGFNTITDIHTEVYTDGSGNAHKREKDMGYNYYFALLGDSINPLEINGKTFIVSLNFIDYLTMSFGNNWASCHTIDKDNNRGCHGSYNGEWSSGTLSYALDNITAIAYIVDEENAKVETRNYHHKYGKHVPYCLRDKEHREVVAWQNDKIYFARVYPDGRDGGEEGIAAQFREIIQQIFAECLNTSNFWVTKKGTSNIYNYIDGNRNGFTAYDDWRHYEDCSISFLRRIDGILNEDPIIIATRPICPCCGSRHIHQENIYCEECCNDYDEHCSRCGRGIDTDCDDYEYIDGNYYCCCDCCRADGYVWSEAYNEWIWEEDAVLCEDNDVWYNSDDDDICFCEDDCDYHLTENCRYDDYSNEYYSPDYDEGVYTADDNWYATEENAKRAGYVFCDDDDKWHHKAN